MTTLQTKLKHSHVMGQYCQRNYDLNQTMNKEDIDLIIHATTQCPSKQNLDYYSVYAIEDRTTIEAIYENTQTERGRKNSQVLGHLLLVFVSNPNVVRHELTNIVLERQQSQNLPTILEDMHQAVGVAAGCANVTAGMLGYRTGYNKCFDHDAITNILNLKDGQIPVLMMGVGIHDNNRNRREDHKTGQIIDSFQKVPIKVTKI